MHWELRESHRVGGYAFHWFHCDGEWVIAVWKEGEEPDRPSAADFHRALTARLVSRAENPSGGAKPLRRFCEQFLNDIPFRVRAIRSKIATLDALERAHPTDA